MTQIKSSRIQHIVLTFFAFSMLSLFASNCAQPGVLGTEEEDTSGTGGNPDDDGQDDDKKDLPRITTSTLLKLVNGQEPTGLRCFKKESFLEIARTNQSIEIDGSLEGWDAFPFQIPDPESDQKDLDMTAASVLLEENTERQRVVIAIRGKAFEANHLEFRAKFGSLLRSDNADSVIKVDTLREYVYANGQMSVKRHDGNFEVLSPELYEIAFNSEGQIEFAIQKTDLDEVILQPLWSIDLQLSQHGTTEAFGRKFFKNIQGFPPGFETQRCMFAFSSQQVEIQEIIDNQIYNVEDDQDTNLDPMFVITPQEQRKRVGSLVSIMRQSFSDSWILLSRPTLDRLSFPIIVSNVMFPDDQLGQVKKSARLQIDLQTKLNPFFTRTVYENGATFFSRSVASRYLETAPFYLKELVAAIFTDFIVRNKVGTKYWLESYQAKVGDFTANLDSEDPKGLVDWEAEIEAGALDRGQHAQVYAKIRSLAMILRKYIPINLLKKSLEEIYADYTSQGKVVDYDVFFDALAENIQGSFREKMRLYESGWFKSESYVNGYSPFELSDEDLDGLPRFFELAVNTNPAREDTDRDGWTDLSEIYALTDPVSTSSRPEGLMPDGSFGDWQELVPDLVMKDEGVNSTGCPSAADVSHYAAIFDGENILIAGAGKDLWVKPPYVRWEVQLDITVPTGKSLFTLRTIRNRYYYDVLAGEDRRVVLRYPSAKPLGIDSMEWFINLSHLGIDPQIMKFEGSNIIYRISTYFEDKERILCDDTPWESPIYSEIKDN